MRCEEIHAHLADHLAGTLAPDLSDDVTAHLRTCHTCAAEADGLNETWQMLGTVPASRPDSAGMRVRFDAALEGYRDGLESDRARPSRFTRIRAYGLQFAAAAAVLVLGVSIGRQTTRPPAPDPQLTMLREELREMRQMVTLSLLQQQSASERLRGVSFTTRIDQPAGEVTAALLDTLMHDPNVNVRLACIRALDRFNTQAAVRAGVVQAVTRETSPLVSIALIDFILEARDTMAIDVLRQLSADEQRDAAVRETAARGVERLRSGGRL